MIKNELKKVAYHLVLWGRSTHRRLHLQDLPVSEGSLA